MKNKWSKDKNLTKRRNYQSLTVKEDNTLIEFRTKAHTYKEISTLMNSSEYSVARRYKRISKNVLF